MQIARKLDRISQALLATTFVYRHALWKEWFHNSYAAILKQGEAALRSMGITRMSLEQTLGWGETTPRTPEQQRKWKRSSQRITSMAIRQNSPCPTEHHLRTKLNRWDIPLLPRKRPQRAIQRIALLRPLVPLVSWPALSGRGSMDGARNVVSKNNKKMFAALAASVGLTPWNSTPSAVSLRHTPPADYTSHRRTTLEIDACNSSSSLPA